MFERFSDRARKVVQLAESAAQRSEATEIAREHVLTGLLDEGSGVGVNLLMNIGVDLRRLREALDQQMGDAHAATAAGGAAAGGVSVGAEATELFQAAAAEARALVHYYVGTEHLMLALLKSPRGACAAAFAAVGATYDGLLDELKLLFGEPGE